MKKIRMMFLLSETSFRLYVFATRMFNVRYFFTQLISIKNIVGYREEKPNTEQNIVAIQMMSSSVYHLFNLDMTFIVDLCILLTYNNNKYFVALIYC